MVAVLFLTASRSESLLSVAAGGPDFRTTHFRIASLHAPPVESGSCRLGLRLLPWLQA